MSQLRNVIVLAARKKMGTPVCCQIVLSMRKKMVKKNSQGAKVDEYSYQPEKRKKRYRHFISLQSIFFPFVLYCLKAGEPVVN